MIAGDPAIFVVDDDEAVLDATRVLLETEGYRVEVFASSLAFLDGDLAGRTGCLLVDVRMPGMNGLELQKALVERGIGLPVIVMTGHGDVSMALQALKAGAVDFLEKPYSDAALFDSLRRALAADRSVGDQVAADARARLQTLTPLERRVMARLVQGQANKAIAFELGIDARVAESYHASVMKKMQADTLSQLARLALAAKVDLGEIC